MPIQNIPLDYGWMVSLVRAISQAREAQQALGLEERRVGLEGERVGMERERMETSQAMSGQVPYGQAISSQARPSQGTQVSRGTTGVSTPSQGVSGSASLAGWVESKTAPGAAAEGRRREERLLDEARKHEILLKQMDVDTKLAEAISKERIAGVETEAGTEQAQIAGAAQVAVSQKTTMEKGREFLEMLWDMDEGSRSNVISRLEDKRAQAGYVIGDPNDPLTWLEDMNVYNSDTGLARLNEEKNVINVNTWTDESGWLNQITTFDDGTTEIEIIGRAAKEEAVDTELTQSEQLGWARLQFDT